MARKLEPVHVWCCPYDWKTVNGETRPDPCTEHECQYVDMGYRVGEAEVNFSWYTTLEAALRDRRCK